MTVAFDAVGPSAAGAGAAAAGSLTWAHTCTGSNLYLVAGVSLGSVAFNDTTDPVVSCKYAGVTMTSLGKQRSNNGLNAGGYVEVFGLAGPATGANNVVVTMTLSTDDISAGSVSFTGVDQTTPVVAAHTGKAFASSAASTVTITSSTGNMVFAAACCGSAFTTSTQTLRTEKNLNAATSAGNNATATAAGAASVAIGFANGADEWGIVGIDINQVQTVAFVAPRPVIVGQGVQRAAVR